MNISGIKDHTKRTYGALSAYIRRVEDSSSIIDENPIPNYGLPFVAEEFEDIMKWEQAISQPHAEAVRLVREMVC